MIWLDTFSGPAEHIKSITNGYEDEITQENPMKLEDIAEPYTPTTYSVDGNDNEITENSERKNIDHEMMKKGIYRIQKLRMITVYQAILWQK